MTLKGDTFPGRSPLPVVTSSSPVASDMNFNQSHANLLKWHGVELFFVPIMMFIGIIGNLCVCYIYHFRWRSNTVTLVKRMLAFLDLVSLMFAYPAFLYVTVRPRSPNFESTCVFIGIVLLINAVASGMVLLIIAVDRYLKLCRFQKGGINSTRSKRLFAASVVLAVLVNFPVPWVFGTDVIELKYYNTQVVYCFLADDRNETIFLLWAVVLGTVFLSVTFALIVLYSHIVKTLISLSHKHDELKRRPSEQPNTDALEKHRQSHVMRSTAKVFIVVTIVFFATYSPYFVTLILSLTSPDIEGSMGPTWKAFYDLAKLSPLIANVTNPIIYSFDSKHFRKEVKKMLTFKTFQTGFFRRRAFSVSARSVEFSQTSS